jgi:hypothetical protein
MTEDEARVAVRATLAVMTRPAEKTRASPLASRSCG